MTLNDNNTIYPQNMIFGVPCVQSVSAARGVC